VRNGSVDLAAADFFANFDRMTHFAASAPLSFQELRAILPRDMNLDDSNFDEVGRIPVFPAASWPYS